MNKRTPLAPLASTVLAVLALVCAVVLEIVVAGRVLPSGVGWDPVSMWHQSTRGKLFVVLGWGVPVLIPLLAFILVFIYVYRRLSPPTVTLRSMQNRL